MKAKKRFGQNFLIDKGTINSIVSFCNVTKDDLIIEIGPGKGALTKYLSQLSANLICFEIDTDMKNYLSKYESETTKVIYQDILSVNLKEVVSKYKYNNLYIVGNLPYYITSPILEFLIESNINIYKMIFMVQKEVADRYSAKCRNSNYGYMTLYLNHYYDVKKELFVPKKYFNPVPKVDSAVITLNIKNKLEVDNEKKFFSFLKCCFQYKRKTLKNNLSSDDYEKIEDYLIKSGFQKTVRPEEIPEEIFIEIFNILKR